MKILTFSHSQDEGDSGSSLSEKVHLLLAFVGSLLSNDNISFVKKHVLEWYLSLALLGSIGSQAFNTFVVVIRRRRQFSVL